MHVHPAEPVSQSGCFIHPGGPHLPVPSGHSTIWDWLSPASLWQQHFKTRHLITGVKQQTHTLSWVTKSPCLCKCTVAIKQWGAQAFFFFKQTELTDDNKWPCCQIPISGLYYLLFQVINFPQLSDLRPPSACSAPISCSLFYKI